MAAATMFVRDYDYLGTCVDFGAGSIKIEQKHVRAGIDPRTVNAVPVNILRSLRPEIECTMIYDRNETAHLGQKSVNACIKEASSEIENVLDLFKLAICYEYQNNVFVKKIRDYLRLKKGDFGELQLMFTDIFKIILRGIRKSNLDRLSKLEIQQRKDPQQYWENIPIELQLPMPSHWDNVQRGILFQAAKAAGFEEIIIRSETLCAAADLCAHHYRALDLSDGDVVLIVDLGCSTAGVATVKLNVDENASLFLVEVGRSHEDGVGGQMVTDEARKRLSISNCSRDYADMSDCMDQLRITEGEFYRQFSSEFEICKRKFPDEDFYSITIKGHHGKFATFGLNKQFMIQCFEIVARKVAAVISKHLEDNVPVPRVAAILCGGGAQNQFNRDFLEEHLLNPGIPMFSDLTPYENHVAHGALGLYPEPECSSLPEQYSFYIVLAVGHKSYKLKHVFSSDQGMADKSDAVIVTFSPVAEEDRVGPRLRINIYGSEQRDLHNKNFYVSGRTRREGLEEWPLQFSDPPRWEELETSGVKVEIDKAGNRRYHLTTRVTMSREDERLMVTTELLGLAQENDGYAPVIWRAQSELWHANRSHNPSNGRARVREPPTQSTSNRKRRRPRQADDNASFARKSARKQDWTDSSVPEIDRRDSFYQTDEEIEVSRPRKVVNAAGNSFDSGPVQAPLSPTSTPLDLTQSPPPPLLPQRAAEANAVLSLVRDICARTE